MMAYGLWHVAYGKTIEGLVACGLWQEEKALMAYGAWYVANGKTKEEIMAFRFEGLEIWQLAVTFAVNIYDMTENFPKDEIFGLVSQLRRAATSISLNIAEGTGRSSRKEFAHFLDISIGSVFEVVTAVAIARKRGMIAEHQYRQIYADAEVLAKKIATFKRSVLRQPTN